MIQALLQQIAEEQNVGRGELSFALVNGGLDRSPNHYSSVALLFQRGDPISVVKWQADGRILSREWQLLTDLHALGIKVPRPLKILQLNARTALILEFVAGMSLETGLRRNFVSRDEALTACRELSNSLREKTRKPSTHEALLEELATLTQCISQFRLYGEKSDAFAAALIEQIGNFFSREPAIETSLCHGDFIFRNIIQAADGLTLIDWEFAHRTHFAVLDWFRLFLFSDGLREELLPALAKPETLERICADRKTFAAVRALHLLSDFRTQCEVTPEYQHASRRMKLSELLPPLAEELLHADDDSTGDLFADPRRSPYANVQFARGRYTSQGEVAELKRQLCELQLRSDGQLQEIEQQRSIISDLISCPAFRIGKFFTGILKLIPGLQRVDNQVRSNRAG